MSQEGLYGKASDSQSLTTLTSTGVIATNLFDAEEDAIIDDQLIGFLNFTILSVAGLSGATQGLNVSVRTDNQTNLATSKTAAGLGYVVVGGIEIEKIDLVAGKQFSIPYIKDIGKKYFSAWFKAVNTTITGTIVVDADFSDTPVGLNETMQKVRTSV